MDLDRSDQVIEILVQPCVRKVMIMDVGDTKQIERIPRLLGPVGLWIGSCLTLGEDHRAHGDTPRGELRERSAASKLEVVGMCTERQNG